MTAADPRELFEQFESLFGDLFGRRTRDLPRELEITLREAAHGAQRTIELDRATRCAACAGKGGAPGARYTPCLACAGRGGEQRQQGMLVFTTSCEHCHGRRGTWTRACEECSGRGESVASKTVTVTIPPGVRDGHTLRLAGMGNDLGEGPGDALVTMTIAAHPTLRRDGDDLRATVGVDDALAERGGTIEVPWLEGAVKVRVPAGLREDTEVRVRGWGCVRLGAPYADPPPLEGDSPYRAKPEIARGDLLVTLTRRELETERADRLDAELERELASYDAPAPREPTRPLALAVGVALIALAIAMLLLR